MPAYEKIMRSVVCWLCIPSVLKIFIISKLGYAVQIKSHLTLISSIEKRIFMHLINASSQVICQNQLAQKVLPNNVSRTLKYKYFEFAMY